MPSGSSSSEEEEVPTRTSRTRNKKKLPTATAAGIGRTSKRKASPPKKMTQVEKRKDTAKKKRIKKAKDKAAAAVIAAAASPAKKPPNFSIGSVQGAGMPRPMGTNKAAAKALKAAGERRNLQAGMVALANTTRLLSTTLFNKGLIDQKIKMAGLFTKLGDSIQAKRALEEALEMQEQQMILASRGLLLR